MKFLVVAILAKIIIIIFILNIVLKIAILFFSLLIYLKSKFYAKSITFAWKI